MNEIDDDIREHIQAFKFKNYSFEDKLKFISLYRRVLTFNCVFEGVEGFYPVILFQDPYEEWNFIICVMAYDIQGLPRNYYPHRSSTLQAIALEFTEGSEPYYSFGHFTTRMDTPFRHVTFYDGDGEPIDTKEVYRLFFQALRHVEDYAEENLEGWAERLEERGFYPVTDEITDMFVTDGITYEYDPDEFENLDEEELNEYLTTEVQEEIEEIFDDDYYEEDSYGYNQGGRSPNDQRSDVKNPNNEDYKTNNDNRSNQMNPNNPAYRSSRGKR